ncbi:helix-turn-helix domain-containing protein, partial [Lactiplantibacillus plantarum]
KLPIPEKPQPPAAELTQLKQENQMLKIENEFLKKLDALDHEKSAHVKP